MRRAFLVALGLWACDEKLPGQCATDSDCKEGDTCYSGFCVMPEVDAGIADGGDDGGADAGPICAEGYQPDPQAGTCVRLEYRCSSTDCGANIQKRECQGAFCTDWAASSQCAAGAICSSDGKSATCTDCGAHGCSAGKCNACSSGACCKSGAVAPATAECKAWDEFRCSGATCGARAEKKHLSQHCDGRSFECMGAISASDWSVAAQCSADQICKSTGTTAASCAGCPFGCATGECKQCNGGACCDAAAGKFRPSSFVCAYPQAYRCAGSTCGAGAQTRTSTQYCTGTSSACEGQVVDGAWETTTCGDQQLCVTDTVSFAKCQTCANGCSGSACWPQCNPADPCCTNTGNAYDCWYDPATRLEWQNPGVVSTSAASLDEFDKAVAYCGARGPGWRVPTIGELRSLVRGCSAAQSCGVTDQCSSTPCMSGCETCDFDKGTGKNHQYWPVELDEPPYRNQSHPYYWSSTAVSDYSGKWMLRFRDGFFFWDFDSVQFDRRPMRLRCARSR